MLISRTAETRSHSAFIHSSGFDALGMVLDPEIASQSQAHAIAGSFLYSADTASRFEEGEQVRYASEGGAALAPAIEQGWRTYNFEVQGLHTYVAGGVRVHNTSILDVVVDDLIAGRLPPGSSVDFISADANGVPTGTTIVQPDGTRVYYHGEHSNADDQTYVYRIEREFVSTGAEGTPTRVVTEWVGLGDTRNARKTSILEDADDDGSLDNDTAITLAELNEQGDTVPRNEDSSAVERLTSLGSTIGGLFGGDVAPKFYPVLN